MNPYKNLEISYNGIAVAAANNTDANGTILDMSGWEGVIFITTITDSAANGVATLKAEGNSANSDSGMTLLTGASAAKTCTVNDDINGTLLIVNVNNPQSRYVQGVRTSSAANIAFGELIAIRYGARELPVTASSTVSTATTVTGV